MQKIAVKVLATFLYVGYLPFIPGTFGSIAGVLLFYFLKGKVFISIFTLSLTILGFLVAGKAEKIFNKKDARCIVIDEVCGMLLSLIFLPPDIKLVIFAFFVFRILDALKPYPAGGFHNLRGSLGIMSDDIVAGLYTNLILQAVLRLPSFRIS